MKYTPCLKVILKELNLTRPQVAVTAKNPGLAQCLESVCKKESRRRLVARLKHTLDYHSHLLSQGSMVTLQRLGMKTQTTPY